MPSPRAAEILQMPHPRDWNGGQMPRSSLGVVWGFGRGVGGGSWAQLELTDALPSYDI